MIFYFVSFFLLSFLVLSFFAHVMHACDNEFRESSDFFNSIFFLFFQWFFLSTLNYFWISCFLISNYYYVHAHEQVTTFSFIISYHLCDCFLSFFVKSYCSVLYLILLYWLYDCLLSSSVKSHCLWNSETSKSSNLNWL